MAGPADGTALGGGSKFGLDDDPYELGEELGSGAAARVYYCTRVRTGEKLAAKVINLQRLQLMGDFEAQMTKLNREVQILQELHHPRIVNLHFVHRTTHWIFLVMELVRGGELFDQIVRNRTLQETEAKYIFCQLLDGVGYMHSRNVIHRDLKPENILIFSSKPAPEPNSGQLHDIKIADFGLSKVINEGQSMAKTFVGTPQYWAPEVLNVQTGGSYTQAADYWSLGAVLFVMLCGRYPFDGKKMPLEEQIRNAAYSMTSAVWQRISENAKDMVRGLLRVNPSERLKLEDCQRHPWLVGRPVANPAPMVPTPPVPQPLSPQGCMVTEVSSGAAAAATVPLIAQPSSASSESSAVFLEQNASQERPVSYGAATSGSPPASQKSTAGADVPSLQVGGASGSTGNTVNETIFCLHELLKLQVSIAGSLEMACLAFRHADIELSDAIRKTFWQARDLFSLAANVVSQYAEVAQQVGQLVLADLKLAVDEKEPALAVSLLGMVKGWVANMKKDGEEIERQYMGLQESVHGLIRRAQHTKNDADRRLAEAVQAVEVDMPPPSPRTQQQFLTNEPNGLSGFGATGSGQPAVSTRQPESALNVPFSMNVWTRQLFEHLSQVQGGSSTGAPPAEKDLAVSSSLTPLPPADTDNNESWKRDVLELLFMAPGISTTTLPKFEQFSYHGAEAAEPQHPPAEELTSRATSENRGDVQMGDAGDASSTAEGGTPQQGSRTPPTTASLEAIVRFVPTSSEKSAAEAVTQSSASLLRALKELKRVDEILHGCSAFWANMDGTVQKLGQMKEHTETLVNFAANSKALKARFDQRLGEYTNFWVSLEKVCRQYCIDHQAASKRMYEVIREVADAADVFDTAQSARMGMVLGMREKQRRHAGTMPYSA